MFRDREEAGERLARLMWPYRGVPGALILALPPGGVLVGAAAARLLELPMDVFFSLRLRAPGDRGRCLGAVTELGNVFVNKETVGPSGPPDAYLERELRRRRREIERLRVLYRGRRGLPQIKGRRPILVDDGAATGATLMAAVEGLRGLGPSLLAAAVPSLPLGPARLLRARCDELFSLSEPLLAPGLDGLYGDPCGIDDETARAVLAAARHPPVPAG